MLFLFNLGFQCKPQTWNASSAEYREEELLTNLQKEKSKQENVAAQKALVLPR